MVKKQRVLLLFLNKKPKSAFLYIGQLVTASLYICHAKLLDFIDIYVGMYMYNVTKTVFKYIQLVINKIHVKKFKITSTCSPQENSVPGIYPVKSR